MTDHMYYPARPAWNALSVLDALVRMGFPIDQAQVVIDAAAMGGIKVLQLQRHDMPGMVDVIQPIDHEGVEVALVLEGHVHLASDTEEEALAKWPWGGDVHIVRTWPLPVGNA